MKFVLTVIIELMLFIVGHFAIKTAYERTHNNFEKVCFLIMGYLQIVTSIALYIRGLPI